jgi:LEA14-like dessication related protein
VTQIDFAGVDMRFDFTVKNPTDRYVRLDAYRWELLALGKKLARGQSHGSEPVDSGGSLTVQIEVPVKNGDVFNLTHTDRPTTLPDYEFRLTALLTGGLMNLPRDFEKHGRLSVLYRPALTLQNFRVLKQTDATAVIHFEALLENQNSFAVHLDKMVANLHLAGRPVAQEIQGPSENIPANGRTVATFEFELDLAMLGSTVVNALRQPDVNYEFDGTTAFDTPWGRKSLNFAQSGRLQIQH